MRHILLSMQQVRVVPESVVPSNCLEYIELPVLPGAALRVNTPCLSSMSICTYAANIQSINLSTHLPQIAYYVHVGVQVKKKRCRERVRSLIKEKRVMCLTWAGTVPSFSSTSGRLCFRPINTRLNCNIGFPLLFFRAGCTTRTLGKFPSPSSSNSSTLVLNVGVILDTTEKNNS